VRLSLGVLRPGQDILPRWSAKSPAYGGALKHNSVKRVQTRESSDKPMLNAFCRVAPSVRLSVLAIVPAGFLLFARDFSVRVSSVVQARRFDAFFAIK